MGYIVNDCQDDNTLPKEFKDERCDWCKGELKVYNVDCETRGDCEIYSCQCKSCGKYINLNYAREWWDPYW